MGAKAVDGIAQTTSNHIVLRLARNRNPPTVSSRIIQLAVTGLCWIGRCWPMSRLT